MKKSRKESWKIKFFAIIIGAVAAIATGGILHPLVMMVFDKFFEWDPDTKTTGITINSFIIAGTLLLWFFIIAMSGGFVSAIISIKREYQKVWILIINGVVAFGILNLEKSSSRDILKIALSIIFLIAGALTGGALGIRYKKMIEKKKINSNIPPFPPDTP